MANRPKIIWKLYFWFMIVIMLSLVAMFWYTSGIVIDYFNEKTIDHLKTDALIAEKLLPDKLDENTNLELEKTLKVLGANSISRITIVLPSGQVAADSHQNPAAVINYLNRPEIQEAFAGKIGIAERYSLLTDNDSIYVAVPIIRSNQIIGVVRATTSQITLSSTFNSIYGELILAGLLILVCAGVLILYLASLLQTQIRQLKLGATRFASGDLEYRMDVPDSEELGDLANVMNQMAGQLNSRLQTITQQRNELEAVLSSMMEAVLVIDNDGHLLAANKTAESLLSIDAANSKGRLVQEVVRNTGLYCFVNYTLASDEPLQGDITFLSNPEKFLQANGTVLKDAKGKEIGAVIVLNDVTRLKNLEKIRRDFVANVSHELKTPVTSIKGFLETLREGAIDDPENSHRFLEIISKNADRLSSIIEDLLILSRLDKEDDGGEVVMEVYSINELVDNVIKDCSKKALSKNIELVSDLPDEIQARINSTLLRQALVNLVDNAIKYSESGKRVSIRVLSDSNCMALSVTDEGCGISKEHHSRIFERFYRVDKGRSRREGGTGLGLSIVKHITNAHNGRISLDSSPGKGSTFTLYIPVDLTQGVPCHAGTFTKRH